MTLPCFQEEAESTAQAICACRDDDSLVFALVTDTHLSDTSEETCRNIKCVDEKVHFQFLLHMGDFLTGGIPKKASLFLLERETRRYQNAVASGRLIALQGNHDGYRDETFKGQTVDNVIFDSVWRRQTDFIDGYGGVNRPGEKPYFYIDFHRENVRLICLCSCYYAYDEANRDYKKYSGFDDAQAAWFETTALDAAEGCTLLVCSHIAPLSELGSNEFKSRMSERNGARLTNALNAARQSKNINVAAWLAGDSHADASVTIEGIPFITTASQAPYIPQLWTMKHGTFPESRALHTVNQDLWDGVVLHPKKRELRLVRFGAGQDRVVLY
ncbi:MAG: metallophosphoesterase [Clostridiales bacterium]|nr:metallophosphoesterase [Clostridiales bacterium]